MSAARCRDAMLIRERLQRRRTAAESPRQETTITLRDVEAREVYLAEIHRAERWARPTRALRVS